ncbi:MAG: hypothetical protein NXI16_14220 [Alphaproteobacteria bacterium]|nr:hypothetical protein [Alphaproteobacteria bacterium]
MSLGLHVNWRQIEPGSHRLPDTERWLNYYKSLGPLPRRDQLDLILDVPKLAPRAALVVYDGEDVIYQVAGDEISRRVQVNIHKKRLSELPFGEDMHLVAAFFRTIREEKRINQVSGGYLIDDRLTTTWEATGMPLFEGDAVEAVLLGMAYSNE